MTGPPEPSDVMEYMTTPTLLHPAKSALRKWRSTWIVLIVGLMITAAATLYMKSSVENIANLEFTSHCNEITNKITERLDDHARILRGGAALFNVSDIVTREEWRIFNKAQKVEKQLPGIQGIGFSLLIPRAELTRHIQKIRREGLPQYKLRPDGERDIYSSIVYLEPFSGRNLRAFGYDMLSEPVRRSAMERARDTDTAALSGKVVLVQETGADIQAGTLMYVPVYRKGMPIETIEQRRASIYGWVYSPYRMNDLMQGIIGNRNLEKEKQLRLQVFDGTQPSIQSMLYDSHSAGDNALRANARFTRQIPVDFNGQLWTLRFTKTGGGFSTVDYSSIWLTMFGGILITLLFFSLIRALLNARDKTRLAESLTAELLASENKYQYLFTNAQVALFRTRTSDGKLLEINERYAQMAGYSNINDCIAEFNVSDAWADPDGRKILVGILQENGFVTDYETSIIRRDGTHVWILFSATIFPEQGFIEGSIVDITARKQAEEALRETNAYLENLINYANAPIIVWDPQFCITRFNHAFEFLTGHSEADVIGQSLEILFPPALAGDSMALIRKTLTGERWETVEIKILHRDESVHTVLWNSATLFAPDGQTPIATIAQGHDITERKQAEEDKEKLEAQNRQLQKAESLGRMAGAIAHTFNNQLGVVIGNLELAIDNLPPGAGPAHSLLNTAMQSAWKAAAVSGQMLTYIGQSFDKRELLDIAEVCRRNLPVILASLPGKVTLETDLPSPGPVVMANENEIQQALTNLITNAWEAVGEYGGAIHLGIKAVTRSDIPAVKRFPLDWQPQDNAYACLTVTDAGSGIADNDIEKLFDPFFSSKFTGRGLGLSVVLGIVKAHGGAVTVESKPGKGSAFRVFLPVSAEEVSPKPDKGNYGCPPISLAGGGTVLLVDDEEMLRNMAAAMLTRLGFTVLAAKDGIEALELFRQHRDEIRLVLSDLTMPRMNGWETLTALRQLAPDLPVILASGYDKAQVMAGDHPELPQVFLSKPYRLKELGDAIGQALVRRN